METCNCIDHKGKDNATEVGKHRYVLETNDDAPLGGTAWRWVCSCTPRAIGKWTYQSPNVCYHSWWSHIWRVSMKEAKADI